MDDLKTEESLDKLLEVDQIEQLKQEYNGTEEDYRNLVDEPQMVDEPIVEEINSHTDDSVELL